MARYENEDALVQEIEELDQRDNYVFRWRGTIEIPAAGSYGFQTASDDGSMLYIDEQLVVDNDGAHGTAEKQGTVELTEGPHDLVITFFERGASCGRGRASLLATIRVLRSPPSLPECINTR